MGARLYSWSCGTSVWLRRLIIRGPELSWILCRQYVYIRTWAWHFSILVERHSLRDNTRVRVSCHWNVLASLDFDVISIIFLRVFLLLIFEFLESDTWLDWDLFDDRKTPSETVSSTCGRCLVSLLAFEIQTRNLLESVYVFVCFHNCAFELICQNIEQLGILVYNHGRFLSCWRCSPTANLALTIVGC